MLTIKGKAFNDFVKMAICSSPDAPHRKPRPKRGALSKIIKHCISHPDTPPREDLFAIRSSIHVIFDKKTTHEVLADITPKELTPETVLKVLINHHFHVLGRDSKFFTQNPLDYREYIKNGSEIETDDDTTLIPRREGGPDFATLVFCCSNEGILARLGIPDNKVYIFNNGPVKNKWCLNKGWLSEYVRPETPGLSEKTHAISPPENQVIELYDTKEAAEAIKYAANIADLRRKLQETEKNQSFAKTNTIAPF